MRQACLRVALVGLLLLLVGLARGTAALLPVALFLVGGVYVAQLAADDAPLDVAAPAVAAVLLVAAELAYWSLGERDRVKGEPGDALRRLALVAGAGAAALVVSSLLLAVTDTIRARGVGVDVAGAVASALVLLAVVLLARERPAGRRDGARPATREKR